MRPDPRNATAAAQLASLPWSAAAERNAPPIADVLARWLPKQARVLEIASGTGQHAAFFASAQPGWAWLPSEPDAQALPHLAARCAGLPNVAAPVQLDVLAPAWPVQAAGFDAVYCANLLHIAPWPVTPALLAGAAQALGPAGQVVIYGPFVVDGEVLAPSNAAFDADLRARHPAWGLRRLAQVVQAAAHAGLVLAERCDMPANNLLLRFARVEA